MDDDFELINRFQKGDDKAFDTLVSKYQNKVYELAYYHIRNVEDAYDVTQEVFLKAYRALRKFKRKSSFYTWLYRITINTCIDYDRHNSGRPQSVPIEECVSVVDSFAFSNGRTALSPSKAVELEELSHLIDDAVNQLPPKQKAIFIMKRYQGLSLQEIAKIFDRSVGTIKANLSHATAKIASALAPYLDLD